MSKRFKAKKRRTIKTKLVWILFICLMLFIILATVFKNFKLATSNEEFVKNLLEDSNYHLKYNKTASRIITNISNFLSSFKIEEPITILEESLGYTFTSSNEPVEKKNEMKMVFHRNNVDDLKLPNQPRVYIYSTHYKESYSATNLEDYNITPNVKMASMLLKEKMNKLGVSTVVEEADLGDFMAVNNWNHSRSYEASRYFVKDALTKNPNLELIIDLHRDAVSKKSSTVEIDGTSYAKILFVCGKENPNYEKNLELMNKLNQKIKEKYPGLTRGVMTHEGKGYNGVYNQDLSPNIILLECGGNENNIGEVTNTLTLIAPIIVEMLNES
ncbi:MAG: hypothetical protein HFH08_04130 [Bacilli bacterium]|nr:hypothetical protein [Bacilli bacterium]